ncbi:acyltransferase [Aurantiacibacter gangjinensis]|nr:hypothetical protein [Aurantiacibacter gangjinensis]APE27890.1 transferase, hexapeptide repeat family [Aurantiacibacter gangjinensis]
MTYRRTGKLWLLMAAAIAVLPSFLKIPIYRHIFGYRIGRGVSIGLSLIVVGRCAIDDGVRIGHGNIFLHCERLKIGTDAFFGIGNVVRGGRTASFGEQAQIYRFNEVNGIINAARDTGSEQASETAGHFSLGKASVITAQHKIDFTGGVTLGDSVILGGRLSSLWTHNRHLDGPITIGDNTYLGSGIQMAPGAAIGPSCIVGIGSVVTKAFSESEVLLGGNPAKIIKPLDDDAKVLVTRPTIEASG